MTVAGILVAIPLVTFEAWVGFNGGTGCVVDDLERNPVVQEHIGSITDCELDVAASQRGTIYRRPTILPPFLGQVVLHLEGTKGSGTVEVASTLWTRHLRSGHLYVDDNVLPLFPKP